MGEIGSLWHKWDLHVHTASSYDAKYHSQDYDEKLVQAWIDNDIYAAAITDHFCIDKDRINHIRSIIEQKNVNITIFPGVEFRTDTVSPNIHVIGIFSEKIDLNGLVEDFRAFLRQRHIGENSETGYISLNEIVKFVRDDHDGLISVHDGKKSNGLGKSKELNGPEGDTDKEFKKLLRHDFRSFVDFLDTNSEKSANDLVKYTCVKDLQGLPVTVNSDIHHPDGYNEASVTWIKAELTFNGLKEAFSQPNGRISFKVKPDQLSDQQLRLYRTISAVEVRNDKGKSDWYGQDLSLQLNPGLVTIIGNKGAGKSALSDVIGLDGTSRNMSDASFLSKDRFNNKANYGSNFSSRIIWADDTQTDWIKLDSRESLEEEKVEYLPQSFIEKIASSVDDIELRTEIEKIVFSALPVSKRLQQTSWKALIHQLGGTINDQVSGLRDELHNLNVDIISLEGKATKEKLAEKKRQLSEIIAQIKSLRNNLPHKPTLKQNSSDEQTKWDELKQETADIKTQQKEVGTQLAHLESFLVDLDRLLKERSDIVKSIQLYESTVNIFNNQYQDLNPSVIDGSTLTASLVLDEPRNMDLDKEIGPQKQNIEKEKGKLDKESTDLQKVLKSKKQKADQIQSRMTREQKLQAQYSNELGEWKSKIALLEKGTPGTEQGSKDSLEKEIKHFTEDIPTELKKAYEKRNEYVNNILVLLKDKSHQLDDLCQNAKADIDALNRVGRDDEDQGVDFSSNIIPVADFAESIVAKVDTRKAGRMRGNSEALAYINEKMDSTELGDSSSIIGFIENVIYQTPNIMESQPDFNFVQGVLRNQGEIYDYLYGLHFLDVELNLTYNKQTLQALSAGEKGLVLLIFYLGLSQKELPLVIDQPEDNLDNQSIYKHLVPYLRYAKSKRQIIVVTHNPNIAIAADADQVIVAEMDKDKNTFHFASGALENSDVNRYVVDILEGTKPAFNLRDKKYSLFSVKGIKGNS
ncbi:hypothetical protein DSM07_03400 [Oenococcus sp. UCMA 16435]|nr:hypothetical protein DSM07_03400 [Oenococcus sp. UCMA 16435]MDN6967817.1 hypothetical protein [Oenococcus sp. UCMA 17063]